MPGSVTELSDNADKQNRTQEKQSGKRRLSRNESEKLRRDKLNMHIAELAKLVPIVASAPRKVDKSSVLRLAVNYLRLHKDLKKMKEFDLWRPGFLTQENLSAALLEAYDGFLLVISQKGIILYVSDLITTLLGHSQMDLLGQSVYSFVHPDDVPLCKEQFQIRPKPRQVNGKTETSSYNNNHDKPNTLSSVYCSPNKGRRSFYVRMLNLTNRDHKVYDLVHLTCHVRTFLQPEHTGLMGSHSVVIGVGRLAAQQPIKDLSLIPTNMQEFITQHTLDGKIIYTDHRQSVCMGRLPHEIHGTSPYDYIYHEDLVAIHYSHQKVIREGNIPSTVFRSYTKSGSLVCIQATSSICCDNWTKQPKFILSNNVIISEDDFSVLMLKQREDLNRILNACKQSDSAITESPQESDQEGPVSAKRQRLEPSPDSQRDSEESANSREEQNLSEETSPLSCMSNSLVDSPHVSPISNQDPASKLSMELTPDVSEASINTRRNDSTNDSNIDSSCTDLQSQCLDSRTVSESANPSGSSASMPSGSSVSVSKTPNLKTVMVQNQLSRQLMDKYQLLESTIEKQESELTNLRQHMVKYLLIHPDVQQAYLKRLQALEAKRKQHESTLRRLKEIHDYQQRALHHNSPTSSTPPCSSGITLKANTSPGPLGDLSSASTQSSVRDVDEKIKRVVDSDPLYIPLNDLRSGTQQYFCEDNSAEAETDQNRLLPLNDVCCPQLKDHQDDSRMSTLLSVAENSASHVS